MSTAVCFNSDVKKMLMYFLNALCVTLLSSSIGYRTVAAPEFLQANLPSRGFGAPLHLGEIA